MVIILEGLSNNPIVDKLEQFENALFPIVVRVVGKTTLDIEEQFWNAFTPIVVIDVGNVIIFGRILPTTPIVFNEVHPWNINEPKLVGPVTILTVVKATHPWNILALFKIVVVGEDITTLVKPKQFEKELLFNVVTELGILTIVNELHPLKQ